MPRRRSVTDVYKRQALRLALVTGNSPGNDMRFSDDKIKAARNFANKLWNATRFILMNLSDEVTDCALPRTLSIEDKWVLSQYNRLVREVTENLDKFELGIAEQKLYDFLWDVLCDWYIELAKSRLQAGGETALCAQRVLVFLMSNTVKLLQMCIRDRFYGTRWCIFISDGAGDARHTGWNACGKDCAALQRRAGYDLSAARRQ